MSRRFRSGRGSTAKTTGVTLLELLVAIAILGVIAGLLYGTFSRTLLGRDRATTTVERYATGRAAMDWLARDLEGSFATGSYPANTKRFFTIGEADEPTLGGTPLLDVTTTSSRATVPLTGPPLPVDDLVDRGDQIRALYHLEQPADEHGVGMDLVRYEDRPPIHTELEDAARAVIAHGVESVVLRCFDGAAWHDQWDSTTSGSGERGIAPRVVEARIRIASDGKDPIELVSSFYIAMGGRHG